MRMAIKWERHASVYCSIVDGSLMEVGDNFTDEELVPFLPLLSTCLLDPSPSASKTFLSKICDLAMKNELLPYLTLDYICVENDIVFLSKDEGSNGFASLDPTQKLTTLCRALQKNPSLNQEDWLLACLCEENIEELGWLLSLILLNMPNILSVDDLVSKLLGFKDGPDLLTQAAANVSELYLPLVSHLLDMAPTDQVISAARLTTITNLVALNPPLSHSILSRMAETRKDCMFATRVVCERLDDNAVCHFLRTHLLDRKGLVSTLIGKSAAKHTAAVVLNRLLAMIGAAVTSQSVEPLTDLLLSMICLYHRCGLKLPPSDLTLITTFICRRHINSDGHLTAALAALIATPTLTFSMSVPVALSYQVEPHISTWLEWMRAETETSSRPALARDLLYVGLGIVGGRSEAICSYFAETLRLQKVYVHQRQLDQWKTLFINSCLSEADLTVRCATLPITHSLSASSGNRLPIHAMAELMSANAFTKHSVDISSWMQEQLVDLALPIHSHLADLTIRFAIEAAQKNVTGLSPQFVENVFVGEILDESKLTVRILVLLYLLCYRTKKNAVKGEEIYPNSIYTRLPIRYLLSVMETRYDDFARARCHLIRLATDIFPHMLPTVDSLKIAKSRCVGRKITESIEEFEENLCSTDVMVSVKAAQRLDAAPLTDQVRFVPCLARAFISSLDSTPQTYQEIIARVWNRLENVVPRMLYEYCVSTWCKTVTSDQCYKHPCLLFRCDRRILSSPIHFSCFLKIVAFYDQACRIDLMSQVQNSPPLSEEDRASRDVLTHAFDHSQTSILIQTLIEVSDARRMKDDPRDCAAIAQRCEIRKIACDFIHQMFIQDKNLMKLVLFQTWPIEMIRPLVECVPSMFVATEFIQEMLALPDLKRRIFAVCLMAEVGRKYRLPESAASLNLVMDVLNTLLKYAQMPGNHALFTAITPSLGNIIPVFPSLAPLVSTLLLRISSVTRTQLAMNCLDVRPQGSRERKLANAVERVLASRLKVAD
ncbi:hypothetical protein Y032_0015g2672 [Ancylostoma ceylanicum]|uniref:Uncharacterized protein n=1 Tax=Ancylostoma ceylanicum TaxID=53326 RepID=A0A016V9T9_9BILA|nr:hypothetical protein Y032_0015g2672 [Ancylostoma ceylanicum]